LNVKQNLAGQPDQTEASSILDMHDKPCDLCADPGPTALVISTGHGVTASGHVCTECLSKMVADATEHGNAMITAKAGGVFHVLGTPNPDGTMPDRAGTVPDLIETYIAELSAMVEGDRHAGTAYEVSFLGQNKERARQIGAALLEIGGHGLMVGTHGTIAQRFGAASAQNLDYAWEGVGSWRA
jgi:hypothetical protein